MKSLKLVRRVLDITEDVIVGNLYVNGIFFCTTIENYKKSIPRGVYSLDFTYSPKFKRKLPLLIVPKRVGIRIHSGNSSKDSSGCILVGKRDGYYTIQNSKMTLESLILEFLKNDPPKVIEVI